MRGGIPGKYPAFGGLPLNLYDPFKLFKKMTEGEKADPKSFQKAFAKDGKVGRIKQQPMGESFVKVGGDNA